MEAMPLMLSIRPSMAESIANLIYPASLTCGDGQSAFAYGRVMGKDAESQKEAIRRRFGAQVRRIREKRGLSQEQLAERLGYTRQNIGSIEKGGSMPRYPEIQRLAEALGVTEAELLNGDHSLARHIEAFEDDQGLGKFGVVRRVPVVSWVAASAFASSADPFPVGTGDEYVNAVDVGARCFALRVQGPSMEPEFRNGSIIIVDPERSAKSGDFVIAKLPEADEVTFKELHVDGGRRMLRPLNAQFAAFALPADAVIIGVVVGQMRSY